MQGETVVEKGAIQSFSRDYKELFKDKRLYQGFQACIWGIIGSGSCKVSRIAANNPITASSPHGERRLRRLVHGSNKQASGDADSVGKVLSKTGAERLKGEHEVLLIMDESDLRKPFGSSFEHLDQVRDLAGNIIPGFRTLNVIGIGLSGQRALLYHKSFSSRAPGFKSINDEYETAIKQVRSALRNTLVGRLLWVLDRGFDSSRMMRLLHKGGDCFVLRSRHWNRRVKLDLSSRKTSLQTCLDRSQELGHISVEKRFFGQTRSKASYAAKLRAVAVHHDAIKNTKLTAVSLSHTKIPQPWLLLSNLTLSEDALQRLELATRIIQFYRQRWAIENVFAWTKEALDWESVRVLGYEALRSLVMFAWLAASFLFSLGTSLAQPELKLLASLGGWVPSTSKPGKSTFTRGLAALTQHLVIETLRRDPAQAKALDELTTKLFSP